MAECFRCKVSGEKERLVDVIFQDEIVKACENCALVTNLTVVRKPTTYQLKAAERPASVYERLARSRGLPVQKQLSKEEMDEKERLEKERSKQDVTLKDLIDRKMKAQRQEFEEKKRNEKNIPPLHLVDNFHWHIMMARRDKKITHDQLAKELGESIAVLKMIEQGKLPEDDYILIPKLENYFKIKLRTDNTEDYGSKENIEQKRVIPEKLSFDPVTLKNLTLADLKEMKRKREEAARVQSVKKDIEEGLSEKEVDELLNEDEKEGEGEAPDKKWWQIWK